MKAAGWRTARPELERLAEDEPRSPWGPFGLGVVFSAAGDEMAERGDAAGAGGYYELAEERQKEARRRGELAGESGEDGALEAWVSAGSALLALRLKMLRMMPGGPERTDVALLAMREGVFLAARAIGRGEQERLVELATEAGRFADGNHGAFGGESRAGSGGGVLEPFRAEPKPRKRSWFEAWVRRDETGNALWEFVERAARGGKWARSKLSERRTKSTDRQESEIRTFYAEREKRE